MKNERLALAHNIKVLRKSKGLNQEELAEKLHIKRSNIAAYETKNVEPRLRIIVEMARFFNIDIASLLSEKLNEDSVYPGFNEQPDSAITEPAIIDLESSNVNEFITKSAKMKKILIGFKSFYTFRKTKLEDISPKNQKIIFDIDNFIQLMEDLINHNEVMISLLSPKSK